MNELSIEDKKLADKIMEDNDMSVEIWLSSDSKHTVHVKAGKGAVTEAYSQAKKIYDQILKDYGKGTVQKAIELTSANDIPTCPEHKIPMKLHPSGVSKKTGRPYNAFWACSVEGCTRTQRVGGNKN